MSMLKKIKVSLLVLLGCLSGCTTVEFINEEGGRPHLTVMRSTSFTLFGASDNQWADRAERAGGDNADSADTGAVQTTTATPSVSLTGGM